MNYLDDDFERAMRTTPAQLAEREGLRAKGAALWKAHLESIGHQVTYRVPQLLRFSQLTGAQPDRSSAGCRASDS
ncbi:MULTISPECIES: hypothetical protein [unclassified Rhodococcus (in: high G+C Gram-positive bacteria)]|uniref:hypothetical protein n=1 Tax=unclassified Rhodococcus (in: high G+C Gram-positive bacteria) TaxID=192944 RepID=UPI00131FC2AE|nr:MULTISPECIES: hypothetical protein [unclassified Rhodococcus (in: high G+C Gram-positive bacteria)]QHE74516.1 hypothetical protein GFS60_08220 [Rhodococcus sp. WAY2]